MLRCNATVVRCSPRYVWVKLAQEQACAGCIKTSCNRQGTTIKLPIIKSQEGFSIGEIVGLAFNENEIIKNTVLWFGLPLVTFFLSLTIALKTIANGAIVEDKLMLWAGIIGLSFGLLFARQIINWRMKKSFVIYRSA